MSLSDPVRSPRASKALREPSDCFMNIINTLSVNQNRADRDREKAKLEKGFKRSDQRLGNLVVAYEDDLENTIQAFNKISTKIQASKKKYQSVKEKLIACKKLLHCKRDELKRLWIEAVERKQVIQMLKEIENLVAVPEKIEAYLSNNQYFMATQLLVSSITLLEGSLKDVDALKDLKYELYSKRERLHNILVQQLHKHLYITPQASILYEAKRPDTARVMSVADTCSPKFSPTKMKSSSVFKRSPDLNESFSDLFILSTSSISFTEVDNDVQLAIHVFVKCLFLLNRIPETIEMLKEICQQELLNMVRNIVQYIANSAQSITYLSCKHASVLNLSVSQDQAHLLLDLFDLIFKHFRFVIANHQCLLKKLSEISTAKKNKELCVYEIADLWSKMQAVLEMLVGEYVDLHNTSAIQKIAPSAFAKMPASEIAIFYAKKRNLKPKKYALFKFDSSLHAISIRTYLKEQKAGHRGEGDVISYEKEQSIQRQGFCLPSIKNITVIFKPLSEFITEIEQELDMAYGVNSPLNSFLSSCAKVFLDQMNIEVNRLLEIVTKNLEEWVVVSDAIELNRVSAKAQLLQSTVYLNESLMELREHIFTMPLYANHFLRVICNILQSYKELCQSTYTGLVQPHSDKRIISASWVRDNDINHFLKSLPNWINLKGKIIADCEESPEEIRLRNEKESENLIINLSGGTLISQHELLLNSKQLHYLALLHESVDWFSCQILNFANSLYEHQNCLTLPITSSKSNEEIDPVPEITVDSLIKLADEYSSIADTCLLVLHLEVRVHCFFYLQPLAVHGRYAYRIDDQELDHEVAKLNADLSKIGESLVPVFRPVNIKYIFEGLGELIATILINGASKIKRINENGIKKMVRNMFAIQQNLTDITMLREVALDRATQYFALLNHTPEQILNIIVENGPQFQEQEYSAIFQLLYRSKPGSESFTLNDYLERLHHILNEVAVSV